jgi:hypothetical protein
LFTLPNVEISIELDGKEVDRFDLDIPGAHVKSLTSASKVIKEYEFSYKEMMVKKLEQGGNNLSGGKLTARQEQTLKDLDRDEVNGTIFVKA